MRIVFTILAALALASALAAPVQARPCNDVSGCVVRAEFCREAAPVVCHVERLFPEQGVGLCTMAMIPAAIQWLAGDAASGKPPHPGFRLKAASCVTPDEADI
jgi:hypothetical protein